MEDYKITEAYFRDNLAALENGKTEVSCLVGRVDIITKKEVIEVKYYKGWKEALGQVLSYVLFFPERTPRVHLIIPKNFYIPTYIYNCFSTYNIRLTAEEEVDEYIPDNLVYIINKKLFFEVDEIEAYIKNILSLEYLEDKDKLFMLELINKAPWIKNNVADIRIKKGKFNNYYFEIKLDNRWKPIKYSNYLQDKVISNFLDENLDTETEFNKLINMYI